MYKYKLVKISNTVEAFLSISKFFEQETELEPGTYFRFQLKLGIKLGILRFPFPRSLQSSHGSNEVQLRFIAGKKCGVRTTLLPSQALRAIRFKSYHNLLI